MYNMHLIINTHWDREYRWSFSETQFRLAEAVDDLIDIMNRDEKFAHFHTDSQASMLEDYLDIRPEREAELKKLVADGRILTGPWYTLPAEFLVTGESLVRNLMTGHRIARRLGKVMKAGYNIFSWGQVSQLPQIYRQFGMDTIIFYRGVDQSKLDQLEFHWKAADGTQVLGLTFGAFHRLNFWRMVYLPYILGGESVSGTNYKISRDNLKEAFLAHVCDPHIDMVNHQVLNQPCAKDVDAALKGLKELIDTVKDKSSVPDLLFLQGFDQENPDPVVTELLEELNRRNEFGQITVASLEDYIEILKNGLKDRGILEQLPTLSGEMLEVEHVGDAFGPLYNGVFSARMPVKMKNNRCEALLTGWAEPAAVWDLVTGGRYPTRPLSKAWKELLKNHQHDGIGGCHVDRITEAMDERYAKATDVGETVVRGSLVAVTGRVDCSRVGDRQIGLVLYNANSFDRTEVVDCLVDVPADWGYRWSGTNRRDFFLQAEDDQGNPIPCQITCLEDDNVFGYLKFGNVMGYESTRCHISLNVTIPACGYTTVILTPVKNRQAQTTPLVPGAHRMENEHLAVKIAENGTLTVTDKQTGRVLTDLHYFEDSSDKGGPLRYDPVAGEGVITTLSERPEIRLVRSDAMAATYRITYRWDLPECVEAPLHIHVPHGSEWVDQGVLQRSEKYVENRIVTEVTLRHGAKTLEFDTRVENNSRDHRLRVMFPTALTDAEVSLADSPFDVVRRPIAVPDSTGWYEDAARTWPTKMLAAVEQKDYRVSVVHDCFGEYEVTDNEDRALALTMLRCFSTAGNPTETYRYQKLAECLGEHHYRYALDLGTGTTAELLKKAQAFTTPIHTVQTTTHAGELATTGSFLRCEGDGFVMTALKQAEEEPAVLLRGYVEQEAGTTLTLRPGFAVKRAVKVTLEELPIEELAVENGTVTMELHGKEIVGVMLYAE